MKNNKLILSALLCAYVTVLFRSIKIIQSSQLSAAIIT